MNRLNKLLFAGTLVPAIALIPFAGAFAEPPGQEHGAKAHLPKAGAMMRADGAMQKHGDSAPRTDTGATKGAGPADHTPPMTKSADKKTADKKAAATKTPAMKPMDSKTTDSKTADKPADMKPAETTPAAMPKHEAAAPDVAHKPKGGMPAKTDNATTPAPVEHNAAVPPAAAKPDAAPMQRAATPAPAPAPAIRNAATPPAAASPANTAARAPQAPVQQNGGGGLSTGGAVAIGAAAGFAGGFIAATTAQRLDDIRSQRHEVVEDGRTYIREPGRTIVEEGNQTFIVHDENDRFRELGYNVRQERQGNNFINIIDRPGGVQIITYTDGDGRMLRRVRRGPDGREFVLIDNGFDGRIRPYAQDVIVLAPPPMRLPPDRYIVDYQSANEGTIYDTLIAPPLAPPPQRYTLDQIRYSPDVRSYVRSVDINTINFDSGSWTVPGEATGKLEALASAIKRACGRNPNSVFLIEGYTDATGSATDNLSLSDRRAQSVAAILTKSFNVPPENLTTQGYGEQNLKVNTSGPSAENRRVVVRNITQLLASGGKPPGPVAAITAFVINRRSRRRSGARGSSRGRFFAGAR